MKYEYFVIDNAAFTYKGTEEVNSALLDDRLNAAAEEGYRLVNVYRNQIIMERTVRFNPFLDSLKDNEDAV